MPGRPVIPLHVADRDGAALEEGGAATPSRRAVVKWLAASAALAASGCSRPPDGAIYSYARLPEIVANGEPRYYASASLLGGYARGVLVGTQQGRPVKVEGNPGHPASLGGTDVFAQAAILQLWDPDRAKLVRRALGAGRTATATWSAFAAAWREQAAREGGALHVLAPRSTSPAEQAQLAALLARHPGARWYRDDAGLGDSAGQGALLAFGRAVRTVHRFDRAKLIVAVGGDPFSQAADGVRQSADWARVRGAALAAGRTPPRLVALETAPGLFGARADERWALSPPAIEAVLWRSAARFLPALPPRPDDDPALAPVADRLASLLAQYRGDALLCAGDSLSAASHALVHALNQHLGAWGRTVDAIVAPDHSDALPPPGTLAELVGAMHGKSVDALVVLGGNPVYTAPARLGFADALAQVPFSAHLSGWRDETSERCTWQLPCGHAFEQWGDARAFDGTATILQPAIAPLYDTRSPLELLALLADDGAGAAPDGQALVRAQWRPRAGPGDFEAFWRDSLRQGVVPDSRAAVLDLPEARLPAAAPPMDTAPGVLWGTFPPDASVGDGSHGNNGWLQELPRPFTSITWGNALHLGPRTALALGVRPGDVVRVRRSDDASDAALVEAPVWVEPGHAEQAATLPLGYGRRAAGSVGNGVGFDTAPLRGTGAGAVALRLEATGRRHDFARTQLQDTQHGRDLARTVSLAASQAPPPPSAPQPTLYPPAPQEGAAWGMAIDLDACIACNACTVACQAENNIPVVGPDEVRRGRAMHWIRIDSYRDDETGRVVSQPVPCMHCENAPCELVCPVGATVHDSEGLNVQVYNRCIGTRFCSNNCPYKVRRFNFRQYSDVTTETFRLMRNPDVSVRSRGVMEKCTYCVQRLSRARREVQKTGQPLPHDAVETACQSACPTRAIHFGDLNDAQSDVARAKASPRHYAMLEELNTHPRTTFLARVNASDGEPA